MEKFKVGDKVKTKYGIGEVIGRALSARPSVLVRVEGWFGGHAGNGVVLGEGKAEKSGADNCWFFNADELELVTPAQPVPIGANPPEEKKVFDVEDKAPAPKRENVLEEAVRVTSGDRRRDYGSAKTNHDRIALLWAAWDIISRGTEDQIAEALATVHGQMLPTAEGTDGRDPGLFKDLDSARDVAMKMILLKIAREANSPKRDNKTDIAGYARCLSQIDGEEEGF